MSVLPLDWEDKENSPELIAFIQQFGEKYYLTAEEINQMRDAVNEMALVQQSTFLGSAEPSFTPEGTGRAYWIAVKPGTYPNYGNVVVAPNQVAFIVRDLLGAYSITQTPLDLSGYVLKEDLDNLTIRRSYTNQITPSPSYNFQTFVISEQGEMRSWYIGKSVKTIKAIGVFIYKKITNGVFTQDVKVQVLHKRGSVNTVILVDIILASELTNNNTDGIIGGYANYEVKLNFASNLTLAVGDQIFVSIQSNDKLYPIFGSENALLPSGEWNDGSFCYRQWSIANPGTNYTTVPALPTTNPNYNALNFYSVVEEPVNVVKELEDLEAKSVTVDTTDVIGKNKFNKIAVPNGHYQTGIGIGSDGVLYSAAGAGSAIGVPVTESTTYVISGCASLRGLRFETANGTLISFIGTIANGTPFTTPALTARISFQIHQSANNANTVQVEIGNSVTAYENYTSEKYVSGVNGDPLMLAGGSSVAVDFEVLLPKNVFTVQNTINGDFSNNNKVSLWIQKFIKEKKALFINNLNELIVNKYVNTANVDIDNLNLSITGSGFVSKYISIPRVSVRSTLLAAQFPKVMYIGDSITTNRLKNGAVVGAGAMWSMAKEMALKNRIDNANAGYDYLCVGRNNTINTNITYKSTTVPLVGYAEGKGGWSAMDYLRHPFRMWVFNQQGAWDLLGLTTLMGRNYAATLADNKLIATTIYGVNTPLITANSYDILVKESQITNLGGWTNSAAQNTAVQNWINGVADNSNVSNEFFDYSKSGTNRFSLAKYIERYKTLANDGVTRLTVGSTAGSKVTNAATTDVCEPTHIVICLGENDRLFYTDYVQIANDVMELVSSIRGEYPNMQIGVALTAIPGDMFPERNPNYSGFFYQSHHNAKYDLYKELTSRFGDVATQKTNKTYLIPTWHTGTPLSNSLTKEVVSEDEPNKIIQVGNDDYNHPGYYHNRSAGIQIYGWVGYTYS